MPAATRYWTQFTDANDKAYKALQEAAENERRDRTEKYRYASDQYDGKHKKFLKQREGSVDPNVIVNLDGEAIDQIIAFAVPDMPTFQTDEVKDAVIAPESAESDVAPTEPDTDAATTSPLEEWIAEAWEENGDAGLLQDFFLYGCMMGHVYTRILPPKDGEEYPSVLALNPSTCITFWRADDLRTVLWHEICYTTDRKYRIDFVNEKELGGGDQWGIYTWVYQGNAWQQANPAVAWTYGYPPIVAWQHLRDPRRYYGKSHILASGLNDSANKIASDIKQILRFHASPRTIGKGIAAKDVETTSIDSFFTVPKDADVFNLEMQSDLVPSMQFYETMRDAHADEMRVVRMKGGVEAFKGITNFGLRVAFMKMNAQNVQLHRNYERGLILITRVMLAIANKRADVDLDIDWPDALPVSDTEETTVAQQQHDLGVISKQTISQRLGLDYEQEQARIDAEGGTVEAQAQQIGQQGGFFGNQPSQPNGANGNPFGGNGQAVQK